MRLHLATLCLCLTLVGCGGSGSNRSGSGGSAAGASGNSGGATARGGNGGGAGTASGGSAGSNGGATAGGGGSAGASARGGTAGASGAGGSAGASGAGGSAGSAGAAGGGGGGGTGGGGAGGRGGGAGIATGGGGGSGGAGNPSCASRPGLIFCDDFESATAGSTPSAAPWSTSMVASSGTVTIDGAISAPGGQRSVHISDSATDYDTLLVLHSSSILPTSSGRFYVRFMARFGSALSTGHNTFVLADLFTAQGQGHNFRFGEDAGSLEYTTLGDSNAGHATGLTIAPDTWTCIEILLDHAKPEIDVWINGAEIADMHHTDYPLDDYDNVRFGYEKYAGPAMEIWYDDIAIGTQPIGCQ
jgi:Cip1-like, core domain